MMSEYNIEQLLKKINELETELKTSKKYGLVWDKENTKEDVVIQCENNIPILEQDKSKKTICGNGNNNILIEGYKQIIDYYDDYIKIRANNMDILIDGKNLDIKEITDFELVVEGDIYSINYQN